MKHRRVIEGLLFIRGRQTVGNRRSTLSARRTESSPCRRLRRTVPLHISGSVDWISRSVLSIFLRRPGKPQRPTQIMPSVDSRPARQVSRDLPHVSHETRLADRPYAPRSAGAWVGFLRSRSPCVDRAQCSTPAVERERSDLTQSPRFTWNGRRPSLSAWNVGNSHVSRGTSPVAHRWRIIHGSTAEMGSTRSVGDQRGFPPVTGFGWFSTRAVTPPPRQLAPSRSTAPSPSISRWLRSGEAQHFTWNADPVGGSR